MTVIDTAAPAPPRRPPYQHPAAAPSLPQWDGHLDTLPMLRATDIRSMERLRAIIEHARRAIADLDAAIAALGSPRPDGAITVHEGRPR